MIFNLIQLLKIYPKANIAVTGHSLGGALANFIALEIFLKIQEVPRVYTFGAPRIGNPEFVKFFYDAIPNAKRVVHASDIVPHLPPDTIGFDFM